MKRNHLKKKLSKGLATSIAVFASAGLIAGCASPAAEETSSSNNSDSNTGSAASFDWQSDAGEELNILLNQHPLADTLQAEIGKFEALTGITVNIETLAESEYMVKITTELQSGTGSYDMFMTASPMNFQYAAPGWIEDLQPWIDNPAETASDWDFEDFYPALISANRWDLTDFGGLGEGGLWALPANEEGYALFYRKDILDAYNISVPNTHDELIAAAAQLDGITFEGKTINGFVSRGDKTYPTLNPFSTFAGAYGAKDIIDGKAAVNSPEGITAVTKWIELMQYAPAAASTYTWYEAMQDFIAGNSAFYIDADHMAPGFESPDSPISGKVGYAMPPEGPNGRSSSLWVWSYGMNAASDNKSAAWKLMQWATSKETLTEAIGLGNMNPTRISVANSPEMIEATADWGDYNQVWQDILADYAEWQYAPAATWPEVGDIWAGAIQSALLGTQSVEEALDKAARDIDAAIR